MKLRPLGKIMLDLEPLLEEMTDTHELQKYEILHLISGWIDCHRPDAIETYEDGTQPVLRYGPTGLIIED